MLSYAIIYVQSYLHVSQKLIKVAIVQCEQMADVFRTDAFNEFLTFYMLQNIWLKKVKLRLR